MESVAPFQRNGNLISMSRSTLCLWIKVSSANLKSVNNQQYHGWWREKIHVILLKVLFTYARLVYHPITYNTRGLHPSQPRNLKISTEPFLTEIGDFVNIPDPQSSISPSPSLPPLPTLMYKSSSVGGEGEGGCCSRCQLHRGAWQARVALGSGCSSFQI